VGERVGHALKVNRELGPLSTPQKNHQTAQPTLRQSIVQPRPTFKMEIHEQKSPSSKLSSIIDEEVRHRPFLYDENVVFRDSSFFKKPNAPPSLPSPTDVREVASRSTDPSSTNRGRPPPVSFPELGLLVKYGTEITIAEGQCMLLIRDTLSEVVPVPEVYGWCRDNGQVFIYMELVDGITLEKSWETMAESERKFVCQQLRDMVDAWRGLKQESSSPPFIGKSILVIQIFCDMCLTLPLGHVGKQPLLDIVFARGFCPTAGPFSSVSDFHDWFTSSFGANPLDRNQPPHPYRSFLPDDVAIVFTHADLHPSNIILSAGPNPHVVSIIDWHQSGWYPDYWEYCKALVTSPIGGEWETKYLPLFLDRRDCFDYWDYFVLAHI
jgi:hypothetical protein